MCFSAAQAHERTARTGSVHQRSGHQHARPHTRGLRGTHAGSPASPRRHPWARLGASQSPHSLPWTSGRKVKSAGERWALTCPRAGWQSRSDGADVGLSVSPPRAQRSLVSVSPHAFTLCLYRLRGQRQRFEGRLLPPACSSSLSRLRQGAFPKQRCLPWPWEPSDSGRTPPSLSLL